MVAERDFLVWKAQLEADRRRFDAAPSASKNDALLMGLALSQAQGWLAVRAADLSQGEREFIDLSLKRETLEREQRERLRRRVLQVTAAALGIVLCFAGFSLYQWFESEQLRRVADAKRVEAEQQGRRALLNDSRRLQDLAGLAMRRSDSTLAALLALEGLPDQRGLDRPYLAP